MKLPILPCAEKLELVLSSAPKPRDNTDKDSRNRHSVVVCVGRLCSTALLTPSRTYSSSWSSTYCFSSSSLLSASSCSRELSSCVMTYRKKRKTLASSLLTSGLSNLRYLMPWLHVKWNYFKIISAFVDVRLKQFYFSAWKLAWN